MGGTLVVQCTQCRKKYRINLMRIPDAGIKARCAVCGDHFTILSDDELPTDKIRVAPEPSTAWVLSGDPGVDLLVARVGLEVLQQQMLVTLLDAEQRRARLERFAEDGVSAPEVLVFGDLHAILEDELLLLLTRRSDCRRVLVSTHHNEEMLARAAAVAGVDAHITSPFDPDRVFEALGLMGV